MQDLQVFYKVSEDNHFAVHCIFDLGDGPGDFLNAKQKLTFSAAAAEWGFRFFPSLLEADVLSAVSSPYLLKIIYFPYVSPLNRSRKVKLTCNLVFTIAISRNSLPYLPENCSNDMHYTMILKCLRSFYSAYLNSFTRVRKIAWSDY